jgi:hypothetical protein
MLETCAAIDYSLPTFITSFNSFLAGASATTIKAALSKALRFKVAIGLMHTSTSESEFAVPSPKKVEGENNVSITSPLKRQKTASVEEEKIGSFTNENESDFDLDEDCEMSPASDTVKKSSLPNTIIGTKDISSYFGGSKKPSHLNKTMLDQFT